MKKIIFATGNADKMKEIRKILADLDPEVVSMKEAGFRLILWKMAKPLRKTQ